MMQQQLETEKKNTFSVYFSLFFWSFSNNIHVNKTNTYFQTTNNYIKIKN